MSNRIVSTLLILTWLIVAVLPAAADGPAGLDWLRTKQAQDGGFAGDFDQASSVGATVEAILAMAALGEDPNAWVQDGNTPLTFLQSQADQLAMPGDIAKAALAAGAAGADRRDFGGVDLIAALEGHYDPGSGLYGGAELGNVFGQSLTILALTTAGQAAPPAALDWLVNSQLEDGSWSWSGDTTPGGGDSNSTAIALQALLAGGYSGEAIANGLAYLAQLQNEDGGFPYQKPSDYGTDTDANSTAYVIQALLAGGEDMSNWAQAGTPVEALQALQKENGAFQWQAAFADDNFLATTQAIPALAGLSMVQVVGITPVPAAAEADAPAETDAPATTDAPAAAEAPAQLPASGGVQAGPVVVLLAGLVLLLAGWAGRRRAGSEVR